MSILRQVVHAGGDLRLHDRDGKTPRDWAVRHSDAKRRSRTIEFVDRMQRLALAGPSQSEDESSGPGSTGRLQQPLVEMPTGLRSK